MAVNDAYIIDAMAIDKNTNTLVLLIIDPYTWAVQELDHLKAVQKKINTYVSYIQKKATAHNTAMIRILTASA